MLQPLSNPSVVREKPAVEIPIQSKSNQLTLKDSVSKVEKNSTLPGKTESLLR